MRNRKAQARARTVSRRETMALPAALLLLVSLLALAV